MKTWLLILIVSIILLNIYKFTYFNFCHYLEDINSIFFIFHILLPSIPYKFKYGFYSLLFNFIVYENFIDRKKRNKGYGKKMAGYLIDNCNFFILNNRTINTYLKILKKKKYNYKLIEIFNKFYLIKFNKIINKT